MTPLIDRPTVIAVSTAMGADSREERHRPSVGHRDDVLPESVVLRGAGRCERIWPRGPEDDDRLVHEPASRGYATAQHGDGRADVLRQA